MSEPETSRRIRLERRSPSYWRVTFDLPPLNVFGPDAIPQLEEIIASLPPDSDIAPEWDAFIASVQRPTTQARIKTLMERGFHEPGDVENRLGHHVGRLVTPGD